MSPASPPNDSAPKQPYKGESTDVLETRTPNSTLQNPNPPQPKSRLARWWKKIRNVWKRPQPNPITSTFGHKVASTHIDLAQTQGVPKGNETALANESLSDTSPTVDREPIGDGTVTFQGNRSAEVSKIGDLETKSREENQPELVQEPEFVFKTDPPGLTINKRIGRGGMGVVYEAADTFGRKFAVKVTRPDKMTARLKERFYSEALEMSKLDNKYLVPIQLYHEHEGLPYFTMKRYESSVSGLIEAKALTQQSAFRIFCDSIRGLAHLHERGYVHRDFKPGNILVNAEGQGLVSDFGLLKLTVAELTVRSSTTDEPILDAPPTQTRGVVGTIPYLSPEVLCSESPKPTPKWDLYAAGITLYEMLNGERPPVSRNPYLYLNKSRIEAIPPIRKVQPKTPKALEKIIKKCCAVDTPYTDARDLLRDLIRYETRWYRRALVSVCLLFLGMVVSLAMLWPSSQKVVDKTIPNPYAELYKELEEGKTVELIPKEGMPRFPFKVIIGKGTTPNCDNKYKSFALYTTNFGETFVELIPSLPNAEYWMEGELFSVGTLGNDNFGGVFFRGQEVTFQDKSIFTSQMLRFCDSLVDQFTPEITYYHREKFASGILAEETVDKIDTQVNHSPTWRHFSIHFGAKSNQVAFENFQFKPIKNLINFRIPPLLKDQLRIDYSKQGSLGLLASKSNLSCRNLTIKQIFPKE